MKTIKQIQDEIINKIIVLRKDHQSAIKSKNYKLSENILGSIMAYEDCLILTGMTHKDIKNRIKELNKY